jgi:hypothetical protein
MFEVILEGGPNPGVTLSLGDGTRPGDTINFPRARRLELGLDYGRRTTPEHDSYVFQPPNRLVYVEPPFRIPNEVELCPLAEVVLDVAGLIDPGAMIAGGYIRDKALGKTPKDIDLYIGHLRHVRHVEVAEVIKGMVRALGFTEVSYVITFPRGVYAGGEVTYKLRMNAGRSDLEGIDVIVFEEQLPSPDAVFNTFDVGLCEIGMTVDRTLVRSSRFDTDARNKTLTVRDGLTPEQVQSNVQHMERLRAKYPDYEVREGVPL